MAKPTGGPAFPEQISLDVSGNPYSMIEGMTLRQYYAGKALTGITANPNFFGSLFQQNPLGAAQFAVECADFLIAELSKETP